MKAVASDPRKEGREERAPRRACPTRDHAREAAVAVQHSKYVAEVIARGVAGRPAPGPFRYRSLGTLAVIGRSRAVAYIGRVQLCGFTAWLLFLLAGFRNRIVIYVNWSWAWFTHGRGARIITGVPSGSGAARAFHRTT